EQYMRTPVGKAWVGQFTRHVNASRKKLQRNAWTAKLDDGARNSGGNSAFLNDRTWLANVGVERFDHVLVLLFNQGPFKLHGEGERAVVEGEVGGEQSKTLDGLELREMRGKALNFRVDERAREGVRCHFFAAGDVDSLLGGLGRDGFAVRNH